MSNSPSIESIWSELRTCYHSIYTEKAYLYWIRLFIRFNDLKHSKEMRNYEIECFLNHLAVNRQVSASTRNLALCAVIFMVRHVLKQDITGVKYKNTRVPKTDQLFFRIKK